jgi:hypothetical protein
MASLQSIIGSLGNAGAISNAHAGIEQRAREDWLVAGLEARLAAVPPPEPRLARDAHRRTAAA